MKSLSSEEILEILKRNKDEIDDYYSSCLPDLLYQSLLETQMRLPKNLFTETLNLVNEFLNRYCT